MHGHASDITCSALPDLIAVFLGSLVTSDSGTIASGCVMLIAAIWCRVVAVVGGNAPSTALPRRGGGWGWREKEGGAVPFSFSLHPITTALCEHV